MLKEYVSEFTLFMNDWMEKHPEEREAQKKGRARWWDREQNVQQNKEFNEARVAVKPYYYDVNE